MICFRRCQICFRSRRKLPKIYALSGLWRWICIWEKNFERKLELKFAFSFCSPRAGCANSILHSARMILSDVLAIAQTTVPPLRVESSWLLKNPNPPKRSSFPVAHHHAGYTL